MRGAFGLKWNSEDYFKTTAWTFFSSWSRGLPRAPGWTYRATRPYDWIVLMHEEAYLLVIVTAGMSRSYNHVRSMSQVPENITSNMSPSSSNTLYLQRYTTRLAIGLYKPHGNPSSQPIVPNSWLATSILKLIVGTSGMPRSRLGTSMQFAAAGSLLAYRTIIRAWEHRASDIRRRT